eukprot:scaffold5498_cov323-Prasinococcus_capsulatus_cf.AAC.5
MQPQPPTPKSARVNDTLLFPVHVSLQGSDRLKPLLTFFLKETGGKRYSAVTPATDEASLTLLNEPSPFKPDDGEGDDDDDDNSDDDDDEDDDDDSDEEEEDDEDDDDDGSGGNGKGKKPKAKVAQKDDTDDDEDSDD